MQKIRISGISRYVKIGFDEERKRRTRVEVDVEMDYDFSKTIEEDNPVIDYRIICDIVNDVLDKGYRTIEKICYEIFNNINGKINPEHLKVKVRKKNPPLKNETFFAEAEIEK
jgi:dihydroneopterin aldolase